MRLPQTRTVALAIFGMVLVSTMGWVLLVFSVGSGLVRASYDLPFTIRRLDFYSPKPATAEVRLVYMDDQSERALNQPRENWDRALHARLIRTLTGAGARAILLDFILDFDTLGNEAADRALADAMRESGRVFIGGGLTQDQGRDNSKEVISQERIAAPAKAFRAAAKGWGLVVFRGLDPDYGVRQMYTGTDQVPTATWRMARFLGASLPEEPPAEPKRWVNYYAPAGTFSSVLYHEALRPAELARDYFKDKIVVVGGKRSYGSLGQERDEFLTPYTTWGQSFATGVEIHATTLLNLLRGDWLVRASPAAERWTVLIFGVVVVAILSIICTLCPFRTAGAAAFIAAATAAVACWLVWTHHVWFDWLVPVAVQTPAALFCALGSNYLIETRRRAAIRRAFAHYLSPHMADEIAEARFSLKPGGKLVEATMMFTDLKGFTALSEQIKDPVQISEVLVTYFNNTTNHILEHKGTIIKYVGDAVFATWGAPITDGDHAAHAVLAAWGMHQYSQLNVHGHHLVTRIGVNTGTALAGNLGSDFRFDYTLIGEAVNLASRLEGLNKYLGTQVLLSDSTWQLVSQRFAARPLGRFVVSGTTEPVALHELLGPTVTTAIQKMSDRFAEGIAAFRSGDLAGARTIMQGTLAQHGGSDGPSEFYLKEIARLETEGLPPGWDGVVHFGEK